MPRLSNKSQSPCQECHILSRLTDNSLTVTVNQPFFLFEVSSLNLDQQSVFVKLSWIFQLDFRTGTQSRNYSKLVETDFYLENASVFISDRCFYGYFYWISFSLDINQFLCPIDYEVVTLISVLLSDTLQFSNIQFLSTIFYATGCLFDIVELIQRMNFWWK